MPSDLTGARWCRSGPRDRIVPVRVRSMPWPGVAPATRMGGMTNALVVIDVQESFRVRPLWQAVSNPAVVERVGVLVDAARAAGDLSRADLEERGRGPARRWRGAIA